jgi:hypothetical protein
MASSDHDRLVSAFRELSPSIQTSADPAWSREPALRVIDCVLSLNRNYDRVVVPRLDSFARERPLVKSVSDLDLEIGKYRSPDDFVREALNYNHRERADILAKVTKWLVGIGRSQSPARQLVNLETWARSASFDSDQAPRIRGFGLAGFQYLRMLFGANTTKPDIRICCWVAKKIGRSVTPGAALVALLESAATEAGVSLRDADTTIWEMLSRGTQNGGIGAGRTRHR